MNAYKNPYEGLSGEITLPRIARAGFQERSFDAGSVRLNYAIGPDNGPALVLIPAQMGTWESYQGVMVPLSRSFQVYAIDVRGHGKSGWTPGDYSWKSVGADLKAFLAGVVKRAAIVAGNSSGGIIALWCAANLPEAVSAAVLEDAPVFSAEMPRFKERDRFVYGGLKRLVESIGDVERRDLADYFRAMEMPRSETSSRRLPAWFVDGLGKKIDRFRSDNPGRPIEVGFPKALRLLIRSLSMFDPDFARAFVDGRFYEGIDHAEALSRARCPMLVMHADWHRYERHGLVGAMDDDDARRIAELAPRAELVRISANHVIHAFKPKAYVEALTRFARKAGIRPAPLTGTP